MARREAGVCVYINIYIERLARLPEAENLGGSRAGCFRLRREGRARERDGKRGEAEEAVDEM